MKLLAVLLVLLVPGVSFGYSAYVPPGGFWFPDIDEPYTPPDEPADGPAGVVQLPDVDQAWEDGDENETNPDPDPDGGDCGGPACAFSLADWQADNGDWQEMSSFCCEGEAYLSLKNSAGTICRVRNEAGDEALCDGGCPDGDKICECIADAKAEIVAIKNLLNAADLPALKNLLNQIVETEAPTIPDVTHGPPVPGFEGALTLPFNGMPQNSVLSNLADQDFGLGDPGELAQRSHTWQLSAGSSGLPDLAPVTLSTDPEDWGEWSSLIEQVRVLLRGFLVVCVYLSALSTVWNHLLNL